ncbi:MAG: 2-dehydropantoate 2-reductase, partial [Gammaproteobacteria bacterium]|nr:2-dehydropantoate 2-reductase [Gammaproteobacteria bacterium]
MKICVVGAGAIGGFLGTHLALEGSARVAALARGTTLVALRDHGWRLLEGGTLLRGPLALATDDAAELGPQDLVVLALKAPALPALAPCLIPLIGTDTLVLPAMNGVPWWFGAGISALGPRPLESVDPGGRIAECIPLGHVIGCVVHASAALSEPGVSVHRMGH